MRALIILLTLLMPWPAFSAGFEYSLHPMPITKATEVYNAPPGTECAFQGRLVGMVPGQWDTYIFQDRSGQVNAIIPKHIFGGFTITPALLIQLRGKVIVTPWQSKAVMANYVGIIGPAATFGGE